MSRLKNLREGNRRSPRSFALEEWKSSSTRFGAVAGDSSTEQMKSYLGFGQGHDSRTRAGKKRRLHEASTDYGPVETGEDGHQTSADQHHTSPSALWLPEKRLLELVIDILQRRDTHDIFAQPVDPNEVQDYYDIIEEPMDFGTMRAKLHEGMYENLQQFEHDAFLVTDNAMYFNSSATVYFRQARSIHELAKKVFHVVKTYPQKLESEFSEARKRIRRNTQGDVRGMKSGNSLKDMQYSLSGSPNTRRSQAKSRSSAIDTRDQNVFQGAKENGSCRSFEEDRRNTYQPWKSNEDESNCLTMSNTSKQLEHVNQQDINYRQSLMSFAKDLGPTAKLIAAKKILDCFQLQKSHLPLASTCTERTPSTNALATAPSHWHPTVMKSTAATFQLPFSGDKNNSHGEFHQHPTSELNSSPIRSHTGELSCVVSGVKSTSNKSTEMMQSQRKQFNQAQSMVSPPEFNVWRNLEIASVSNNGCTYKLSPVPVRGDVKAKAAQGPSQEIRSTLQTSQVQRQNQIIPQSHQFTFDLPYLRAQLDKMNYSGQDHLLHKNLSAELKLSDKIAVRETRAVPSMWN